jgi:PIN like domain
VTADPESLRFYVDESALGIGKTLAAARKDTLHVGHALIPECPAGALDTEWIPAVSARDLVVLARDRHIRTRPGERRLLREAGLRVFWIAGKKDLSTWQWLERLVRQWDAMEEIIRTRGPGPWFQAINEHGISEIPLD